ncbi:MAG: copper chaperone [Pedobacter sp.]|nr:MAG: copper chaperone [Pedobacter sp.]
MKSLIMAMALFISVSANAQITKVTIQASGLTCSMCSNSINKSLQSLDIVDKVYSNIQSSSFDVTFKPNSVISFDALKKKVEDAGFSVAKLTAAIRFDQLEVGTDQHIKVDGMVMHFLNAKDQTINGVKTVQVVDRGYVSAKQFKKNELYTSMPCYKTGVAGSCCSKSGSADAGQRIYHVTI